MTTLNTNEQNFNTVMISDNYELSSSTLAHYEEIAYQIIDDSISIADSVLFFKSQGYSAEALMICIDNIKHI